MGSEQLLLNEHRCARLLHSIQGVTLPALGTLCESYLHCLFGLGSACPLSQPELYKQTDAPQSHQTRLAKTRCAQNNYFLNAQTWRAPELTQMHTLTTKQTSAAQPFAGNQRQHIRRQHRRSFAARVRLGAPLTIRAQDPGRTRLLRGGPGVLRGCRTAGCRAAGRRSSVRLRALHHNAAAQTDDTVSACAADNPCSFAKRFKTDRATACAASSQQPACQAQRRTQDPCLLT